jgi:hypothetical protein
VIERRTDVRHATNLVVSIHTEQRKDRVGITSDVSATGLLLHSLSRFQVGDRVHLVFQVGEAEQTASGRVVRAAKDARWELFPNVAAVRFETPRPEISQQL